MRTYCNVQRNHASSSECFFFVYPGYIVYFHDVPMPSIAVVFACVAESHAGLSAT